MRDLAEQLEERLVIDDARVLERVGDIVYVGALDGLGGHGAVLVFLFYLFFGEDALGQGHGALRVVLVERQYVGGGHPAHAGEDDAQAYDEDEVH